MNSFRPCLEKSKQKSLVNIGAVELLGVVIALAMRKADEFKSHTVHQEINMNHKEIKFRAPYLPADKVKILNTDKEGTVIRLSSAGEVEYIHVSVNNIILTFRDFQIAKM